MALQVARWLSGKESASNAEDAGSILGQEDPLEKGIAIPFSVFLPVESHGQRGVAGYKELDMTEATKHICTHIHESTCVEIY